MNYVNYPEQVYYASCEKDKIIVEIPLNSQDIVWGEEKFDSIETIIGKVKCPKCSNTLNILSFKCNMILRPLYHLQKLKELERRISELEYSPPPEGGNKFRELMDEAKKAGDFS